MRQRHLNQQVCVLGKRYLTLVSYLYQCLTHTFKILFLQLFVQDYFRDEKGEVQIDQFQIIIISVLNLDGKDLLLEYPIYLFFEYVFNLDFKKISEGPYWNSLQHLCLNIWMLRRTLRAHIHIKSRDESMARHDPSPLCSWIPLAQAFEATNTADHQC